MTGTTLRAAATRRYRDASPRRMVPVTILILCGCSSGPGRIEKENDRLREQVLDLETQNARLQGRARELEAQLLLKAANEIQKLHDNWDQATPDDIDNILTYNRKLWMLFFDTAIENPEDRPVDLRTPHPAGPFAHKFIVPRTEQPHVQRACAISDQPRRPQSRQVLRYPGQNARIKPAEQHRDVRRLLEMMVRETVDK